MSPAAESAVYVTVRADTVTFRRPEDKHRVTETSARNQLRRTVLAVDREDALARVELDIGADRSLTALLTAESPVDLT